MSEKQCGGEHIILLTSGLQTAYMLYIQ